MKLALINTVKNKTMPPIGLVSIATYLKRYHNFKHTEIIDVNWEDPIKSLKNYRPDVVGISSISESYQQAIELAKKIKSILSCPIIIGGVHISTLPTSLSSVFDFGVIGEGEETVLDLVKLYENEGAFPMEKLKNIPGLVWRENQKLIFTDKRELIQPLDKIPCPDMNFFKAAKIFFKRRWIPWNETEGIAGFIMTARGCPYRCAFCSSSKFWQRVRLNSPERIYSDVKFLMEKYHVTHIEIWDDLLTVNKNRLKRIAEMFKSGGIGKKVSFLCSTRANLIDEELCQIMKEINITAINFGFESGNNRVLRYLKAGSVSLADNIRAVRLAKRYGFHIFGSFVFGSPTETLKEMQDTLDFIDFIANSGCKSNIWNYAMTPFPATTMWKTAKECGKVNDDNMDWRQLTLTNINNPLLLDKSINKKEFQKIFACAQAKAERLEIETLHLTKKIQRHPLKSLRTAFKNPKRLFKLIYLYGQRKLTRKLTQKSY